MWCTYWANKYLSHVKRLWHDRVGAREIPDGHSFALNSYLCKKWLSSTEYVEKPTYPSYIHILRGSLFMMWLAILTNFRRFWIPILEYINIQNLSAHIVELLPFPHQLCCHCHLRYHNLFRQWVRRCRRGIGIYPKCAFCNLTSHMRIATVRVLEVACMRGHVVMFR